MGWLFAVARGLQGGGRAAVVGALGPIALGHGAAILIPAALVAGLWPSVDLSALRLMAAAALIGFGVYRLVAGYRHRVRFGMQASVSDLALWSFLMATAHGAGLMVVPAFLEICGHDASGQGARHLLTTDLPMMAGMDSALKATLVHTAAMYMVTAALALLIYEWVGLAVLRRGWVNLDLLWSSGLIAVGGFFFATAA
jgi:hypothetical protein